MHVRFCNEASDTYQLIVLLGIHVNLLFLNVTTYTGKLLHETNLIAQNHHVLCTPNLLIAINFMILTTYYRLLKFYAVCLVNHG